MQAASIHTLDLIDTRMPSAGQGSPRRLPKRHRERMRSSETRCFRLKLFHKSFI